MLNSPSLCVGFPGLENGFDGVLSFLKNLKTPKVQNLCWIKVFVLFWWIFYRSYTFIS